MADPGSLPGSRLSAWLSNWVWVIPITMLAFLFLLFPTGRLLSRRWNPVAWGAVVSFSLVGILGIINATEMWRHPFTQSQAGGAVGFVLFFPFVGAIVASLVAVLVRFRRSAGDERLQLK